MVQGCLSLVVVDKQGFTGLQGQEGQGRRPFQATQRFTLKIIVIESDNLQYDTLGRWDNCLIDQAPDVTSIIFLHFVQG